MEEEEKFAHYEEGEAGEPRVEKRSLRGQPPTPNGEPPTRAATEVHV